MLHLVNQVPSIRKLVPPGPLMPGGRFPLSAVPGRSPAAGAVPGVPGAAGPPAVAGGPPGPGAPGGAPPPGGDPNAPAGQPAAATPTGPGWVIQLKGYHYHNSNHLKQSWEYLRSTLIHNLEKGSVDLPVDSGDGKPPLLTVVPIKDLGISCPVIATRAKLEDEVVETPDAEFEPDAAKREVHLKKYPFIVQYCWQETPPSKRREKEVAARIAAAQGQGGAVPAIP